MLLSIWSPWKHKHSKEDQTFRSSIIVINECIQTEHNISDTHDWRRNISSPERYQWGYFNVLVI